jgi:hypothetical protein
MFLLLYWYFGFKVLNCLVKMNILIMYDFPGGIVNDGYLTVQGIADKWGFIVWQVKMLSKNGRIAGVQLVSRIWLIPKTAKCLPKTGYLMKNKAMKWSNTYIRHGDFQQEVGGDCG